MTKQIDLKVRGSVLSPQRGVYGHNTSDLLARVPAIPVVQQDEKSACNKLDVDSRVETLSFPLFSFLKKKPKADVPQPNDPRTVPESSDTVGKKSPSDPCRRPRRHPLKLNKSRLGPPTPGVKIKLIFERDPLDQEGSCDKGAEAEADQTDLHWLKEFPYLADRMRGVSGPPWGEVLASHNPLVVEQFVELYDMLHLKKDLVSEELKAEMLLFSLQEYKKNTKDALQLIGKLIYLLDRIHGEKLPKSITCPDSFRSWIHQQFDREIHSLFQKVEERKKIVSATGLYNPETAGRNETAVFLADVLLSKTGNFNAGIVKPLIREHLLPEKIYPQIYREDLIRTLREYALSPALRTRLSQIQKPASEKSPANTMIRASLRLPAQEKITDLHARKTALSATLTHLRQGKDGSCFATPLAILLLNMDLKRCLEDFSSLLQRSKLTRKVNHVSRDFPFILRMSGENLDTSLLISRKLEVLRGNSPRGKLDEDPGLIAACKAIGVENINEAIESAINPFFKDTDSPSVELPVKKLLQNLVKYAKTLEGNKPYGVGQLYLRACFAFDSVECNPLLHCWANAIAGMAEADETGMVRSAVINTVMDTLKPIVRNLARTDSSTRKAVTSLIEDELAERVHLQYDPGIPSQEPSRDQKSTEGAFVLYDKNHCTTSSDWLRVDNPESFRDFLSAILKSSQKRAGNLNPKLKSGELRTISRIIKRLRKQVSADTFLYKVLEGYYHRNADLADPLNNYTSIKYSPWVTKCGNNFSKVVQVYLENFMASNSESLLPETAKELLLEIVRIGRNLKKENEDGSPPRLIPVRIPGVHAFNLHLCHESLSEALNQECDLTDWLNRSVLIPGKQIAESRVDEEAVRNFTQALLDQVIPEGKKESFASACRELEPEISVKSLRESAVNAVASLLAGEQIPLHEVENQVDMVLIDSLPQSIKEAMHKTAVHFADTNWSDGLHDIQLCFMVNPGNGNLEMFAAYESGDKLFPLNSHTWLSGKKWEIFTEIPLIK